MPGFYSLVPTVKTLTRSTNLKLDFYKPGAIVSHLQSNDKHRGAIRHFCFLLNFFLALQPLVEFTFISWCHSSLQDAALVLQKYLLCKTKYSAYGRKECTCCAQIEMDRG